MSTIQLRRQMCQPVERLPLEKCLCLLGLKPDRKKKYGGGSIGFKLRAGSEAVTTEGRLYDLLELARAAYLRLCKKFRVDLARNHERGVWLTALWSHTKELFRRRGIEST